MLTLTGAKAALGSTPGMIGYGMAKAAVHQLISSLSGDNGGLPENSCVAAILPLVLYRHFPKIVTIFLNFLALLLILR